MPNVPTKEQVGARIAELVRAHAGGNQSQFARLCGIDAPNVSRYAAGLHIPGGEHLARMAIACNVSVDWILGMSEAVNGVSSQLPDGKIQIPARAVALVDFEAVRRFLADQELGNRSTAAIRLDDQMRLVDAAEFATVQRQLDDAAKAKGRRRRRPDTSG